MGALSWQVDFICLDLTYSDEALGTLCFIGKVMFTEVLKSCMLVQTFLHGVCV